MTRVLGTEEFDLNPGTDRQTAREFMTANPNIGTAAVTAAANPSILNEAYRLVHGDRGDNYGHPLDDMGRTAGMLTAMLGHKLAEPLLAEDVAKIMICVKLSRETNLPKRDNRVDGAGYFEALDMIVEERERRRKEIMNGNTKTRLNPPALP